jgi:hypothetical protein
MLADGTVIATSCLHSNCTIRIICSVIPIQTILQEFEHYSVRTEAGQGNPLANHNSKILNQITDKCRPEMYGIL